MNTTDKGWKPRVYLDALGSASVIVTSILIFLAAAVIAISSVTPSDAQTADVCPAGRFAQVEYADQRPGAPQTSNHAVCA